jgi:hypothetical protein
MGGSVEHERPLEPNVGDGFSVDIWSPRSLLGPLAVNWKGILGCTVLNENAGLEISISLFLYCNGKKIVTKSGKGLLEYRYVKDHDNGPHWSTDGWKTDEYGEYEFFDDDFVVPSSEPRL